MARSPDWTRRIALTLVALLALISIAARPQSTTLRGTVFNDGNRNGKRDAGEAAVVDVRIQVTTPDLSFVQEYRSGDDGTFGPAVSQGTFTVRIIPPDGWSVTTLSSYTVFVQKGTAALGLDFGIVEGKAGATPAGATTGSGTTGSPGTLPSTGGEPPLDVWPFLSVWLLACGAAFIALTTLAPRVRRK
jgi:hypothetical protein